VTQEEHAVPYLRRTTKGLLSAASPLKDLYIRNGLEAKICLRTYKAHHVEETSDVLIRSRHRRQSGYLDRQSARRKRQHNKFTAWTDDRLAAMPSPDEEEASPVPEDLQAEEAIAMAVDDDGGGGAQTGEPQESGTEEKGSSDGAGTEGDAADMEETTPEEEEEEEEKSPSDDVKDAE